MEGNNEWIPIGKAAQYMGISRDTLRRWEKAGKLKAVRSPSNRRYYTKKQLDQIMNKTKEEAEYTYIDKSPRKEAKPANPIIITIITLVATLAVGFLLLTIL